MKRAILLVIAAAVGVACEPTSTLTYRKSQPPITSVQTSWLGNTYGGGDGQWVQGVLSALHVLPDDRVVAIGQDNEPDISRADIRIYQGGRAVGAWRGMADNGRSPGKAISGNGSYVFVAGTQARVGQGGHGYPPENVLWRVVRRFHLDGRPAPFAGGGGPDGSLLIMGSGQEHEVHALAASASTVLVATHDEGGKVTAFDPETMLSKTTFSVAHPAALAIDRGRGLWVAEGMARPERVLHFSEAGMLLPTVIERPDLVPVALAVDNENRLLVADGGTAQQIFVYVGLEADVSLAAQLGDPGGLRAARGKVSPKRLDSVVAVGASSDGQVVVGMNMTPGGGARITSLGGGTVDWELFGLPVYEAAALDPVTGDVFTRFERFDTNWQQPAGAQFAWHGHTIDAARFPLDPRLRWCGRGSSGRVLWLQGKRFWADASNAACIKLFRFTPDAETAIPAVVMGLPFSFVPAPFFISAQQGFFWRDGDADGTPTIDEIATFSPDAAWGGYIDDAGDIWRVQEDGNIVRVRFEGLGLDDVPKYTWENRQQQRIPPEFDRVQRLVYTPGSDTMVLSGYTKQQPNPYGDQQWVTIGTELLFYNDWDQSTRSLRWRVVLGGDGLRRYPSAMAMAGDRLFVMYTEDEAIAVFDVTTGAPLGTLRAGAGVHANLGVNFIGNGMSAFARPNGELVVFIADRLHAKVTVLRLPPNWKGT